MEQPESAVETSECPHCEGTGAFDLLLDIPCEACGGSGQLQRDRINLLASNRALAM